MKTEIIWVTLRNYTESRQEITLPFYMRESLSGHLDKCSYIKIENEGLVKRISYEAGEIKLSEYRHIPLHFFIQHEHFISCTEEEYLEFEQKIFNMAITFLTIK